MPMIEMTEEHEVAILRMAHGKANALDVEFCRALADRFEACRSSAAKAVLLTGQGHIFSAGVDLVRLLDGGPAYIRDFLPALSLALEAVFFHPKPVVMAINGHAIAGGCVLACAGDKRLMVREPGRIGVTELLVGVPFPARAFEIMRFAATPQYFHDIMYRGATFGPDEAVKRGLVDEAVDGEALLDRALAAARALAALPSEAFALTKRQSRQLVRGHLERHGREWDEAVERIWLAPETSGRIRGYVSRILKKG